MCFSVFSVFVFAVLSAFNVFRVFVFSALSALHVPIVNAFVHLIHLMWVSGLSRFPQRLPRLWTDHLWRP